MVRSQKARSQMVRSQMVRSQMVRSQMVRRQTIRGQIIRLQTIRRQKVSPHTNPTPAPLSAHFEPELRDLSKIFYFFIPCNYQKTSCIYSPALLSLSTESGMVLDSVQRVADVN